MWFLYRFFATKAKSVFSVFIEARPMPPGFYCEGVMGEEVESLPKPPAAPTPPTTAAPASEPPSIVPPAIVAALEVVAALLAAIADKGASPHGTVVL
jgi:hypothetical protein